MNRTAVYGCLLVALGLAAGLSLGWRRDRSRMQPVDGARDASASENLRAAETAGRRDLHASQLERRVAQLAARLATETEERQALEGRLTRLTAEIAALRGGGDPHGAAAASASEKKPALAALAANATTNAVTDAASDTSGITNMEGALVAAGVDATTATEIKRRDDELALSEIYLRDQATREGWLNTPRFNEEMAKINQQRTPLRAEIGDDAYDRYLAALDHPNRVAVNDVFAESPAADAGLQAGDVVLSYGDTRIFSPNELVNATRSGTAGEPVQLEIIRDGQRFEIEVPRGPLGVRIAASKGDPTGG
jgi:C-terminal processing protease CtpA/Prc